MGTLTQLDRRRTRAISLYLAYNRKRFVQELSPKSYDQGKRRFALLKLARRAFHRESAEVQGLYLREAAEVEQQEKAGKQAALADGGGGVGASGGIGGGVEASGGIQASHGVAAPTTPLPGGVEASGGIQASHGVAAPTTSLPGPVQTPVPLMNGDLHVPDAQAVGGGQHAPRTSIFASSRALPVQQMLGCGDVKALTDQQVLAAGVVRASTAGPPRTPSWGQHFELRGSDSGIQAKVHACIVSHVVDLVELYGDATAADVLGSSLRCLQLFESAIGSTDAKGFSRVRVKAAAILGLAAKMVVSADLEIPVTHLWTRVAAGPANIALVKAFEIQLLNQWPGLAL